MTATDGPTGIIWDITYTCPLRCTHCYSESGRRPSRQLSYPDLIRATDALIAMRPRSIALAGGEPLVVKGILDIIERIGAAGIGVELYTGGWSLLPSTVKEIARLCVRVNVSVDGASAEVHDRVRGRAGSFKRALNALALLDEVARDRRLRGDPPLEFGIDATIVRSSFGQLERFCTDLVPRFPELRFIWFGAAIPSGLANRAGFVEHELLTEAEIDQLTSADQLARMRSLTPESVRLAIGSDPRARYHPSRVATGKLRPPMQVEPDGEVRGIAIYEGTVGNVLTDSPALLWQRVLARWSDPFVIDALSSVRSMRDWAEAARRIDYHFGSAADRARIDRRPAFVAAPRSAGAQPPEPAMTKGGESHGA